MSISVAVMQPYFMPYLTYWALIKKVDYFIIFDDAAYKKKGFIDRNKIIYLNDHRYIKINLHKASQNRAINEHAVAGVSGVIELCRLAYSDKPYYYEIEDFIESFVDYRDENLSDFLEYTIGFISKKLKINTVIHKSSSLAAGKGTKDKIIPLVKSVGGNEYVNMARGGFLYDTKEFECNGIRLSLFDGVTNSGLSIIHDIALNGFKNISKQLEVM